MIALTRLNNRPLVVNAELIKFVESTPDTMITMTTGDKIMVRESLEQVVDLAIRYGRRVRCFAAAGADVHET
jgi:flagellar protein FlbD